MWLERRVERPAEAPVKPKNGLVPKTGFDHPKSFDVGMFSPTNFEPIFCQFWFRAVLFRTLRIVYDLMFLFYRMEDLWAILSTIRCLVLLEDPGAKLSTIGCLVLVPQPWAKLGTIRCLFFVEDPWGILSTIECLVLVEDPWAIQSTMVCFVLVEDPFDLLKCQEQFPKFSFWSTPELNN